MTRTLIWVAAVAALALAGCKKDDKKADKPDTTKPDTTKPDTPPDDTEPDDAPVDVKTEEVTYKAGDTELKGFLAYPAGGDQPVPGVLVVHEWWGHNQYSRDRAKMLAELGYAALAVDMYGGGKNTEHPKDAQKFMMEVMNNIDVGVARFEAARELLAGHERVDKDKIAAIGYCFGGSVVLHMARVGADLDVVAAFHPGGLATKTPAKEGVVKAKVFVAHGAADPFVKPEQIPAIKEEMEKAKVDFKFVAYENAKHAFTNPAATEMGKKNDLPLEYNEEADKKSWGVLEAMLAEAWGS